MALVHSTERQASSRKSTEEFDGKNTMAAIEGTFQSANLDVSMSGQSKIAASLLVVKREHCLQSLRGRLCNQFLFGISQYFRTWLVH